MPLTVETMCNVLDIILTSYYVDRDKNHILISLLENAGHLEMLMALILKEKETDLKGILLFPKRERKEGSIH